MSKRDFWGKPDLISLARSLRLAVVQQQFDVGNLTEGEAQKLLNGPLDHSLPLSTTYDDSDCLGHGE